MNYFIATLGTLFLLYSLIWALLPGGFGITNFGNSHTKLLFWLGMLAWVALLLMHPLLIYYLWSDVIRLDQVMYRWIVMPIPFQVLFFMTFARDVSTG